MADDWRATMEPSFPSDHREPSLSSFAWPDPLYPTLPFPALVERKRANVTTQHRCHSFRIDLSGTSREMRVGCRAV